MEVDDTDAAVGAPLTPDQAAMVEANMALVPWTIRRYYPKTPEWEMDDKIADGTLGLIRAVQKFDPAKAKLSTYAVGWIRSAIQRGHAIAEGHGFRYMTGYPTGNPRGDYERPTSLDRPLTEDGGATLGDLIADDRVDVEARALGSAYAAQMQAALIRACKDPLDVAVAEAISTGERDTDVERRMGVQRGVVRFRKERLIAKVRHPTYGLVARIPKDKEKPMSVIDVIPTNGHQPTGDEIVCEECGQTCVSQHGLDVHRGRAHQEPGSRPAADVHRCPECGKEAASDQGVKVHIARVHGPNAVGKRPAEAKPPKERPKLDSTTIKAELYDDGYDPYAVIVGDVDGDEPRARTVILSTRSDAQQVAALLAGLGHKAWQVRLSDAEVAAS